MAATKKKKLVTAISPAGTALWCKPFEPDTQFNPAGTFSTKLVIPADECEEFTTFLTEAAETAFAEKTAGMKPALAKLMTMHVPFTDELDDDTGEPTGNIVFSFKANATYKTQQGAVKHNEVRVFDSAGNPIARESGLNIGNGSTIKVSFAILPFESAGIKKAGISLQLRAIQILDLVMFGGNAASYGFSSDAGFGYTSPTGDGEVEGDDDDDASGMDDVPF